MIFKKAWLNFNLLISKTMIIFNNYTIKNKKFLNILLTWGSIFCFILFMALKYILDYYTAQHQNYPMWWVSVLSSFMNILFLPMIMGFFCLFCELNHFANQGVIKKHEKNKQELDKIRALNERNWFYTNFKFLKNKQNIRKKYYKL